MCFVPLVMDQTGGGGARLQLLGFQFAHFHRINSLPTFFSRFGFCSQVFFLNWWLFKNKLVCFSAQIFFSSIYLWFAGLLRFVSVFPLNCFIAFWGGHMAEGPCINHGFRCRCPVPAGASAKGNEGAAGRLDGRVYAPLHISLRASRLCQNWGLDLLALGRAI